eukprot:m.88080 g.88080  ORF g.88080 m.88080 type:complete len:883 (-) comp21441_c0_seq1:43-2691(-)
METVLSYARSCDVLLPLSVRIDKFEGERPRKSFQELTSDPLLRFSGLYQLHSSDLFVTCHVCAHGHELCLPKQTSRQSMAQDLWSWQEWLTLPVKYADLYRDAEIVFTIWDIYGPLKPTAVGGTSLPLFSVDGTVQKGTFVLKIWPEKEGDGLHDTTPGQTDDRMDKLEQLCQQHSRGELPAIDWLDQISFRKLEEEKQKCRLESKAMYLTIFLPSFDFPVVYCELTTTPHTVGELALLDPEILFEENLAEEKHRRLTRSRRQGPHDRDIKPNPTMRDLLSAIIMRPPTDALQPREKDLIWEFRYYLTREKKALTKFLRCVDWKKQAHIGASYRAMSLDQLGNCLAENGLRRPKQRRKAAYIKILMDFAFKTHEVDQGTELAQAVELLGKWAAIDVDDALELLSKDFQYPAFRAHAVSCLEKADVADLELYSLQLVQALRYEDAFTGARVPKDGNFAEDVHNNLNDFLDTYLQPTTLASFLVKRALHHPTLGNKVYWYISVEADDKEKQPEVARTFGKIRQIFTQALQLYSAKVFATLTRQLDFLSRIRKLAADSKAGSGSRPKKIEKLRAVIAESEEWRSFEPLPLPFAQDVVVNGLIAEKCSIFKSALTPLGLTFKTTSGEQYGIIYKSGDDLRQDQLVIQIITLMDRLLKKENLDLCLTPYRVLATSPIHGMVERVPSENVADILNDHNNSIQAWLKKHNYSEEAPYNIHKDVMDTYVKSCAGYCVITYLLGVGDRHLDNLLMRTDGHLFHIDFGYMLGRDPKVYPPPMKLSKDMVEAMGGASSEEFKKFRSHCYNAFLILRKHSNLILNLFALMVDSNVHDIALDPDKTVLKVLEKFRLDLGDERAVQYFQELIDESVNAIMAVWVEKMHTWAQYWRK